MTNYTNNEIYWYWMCNIPGLSKRKLIRLLKQYKSPKMLYETDEDKIQNIDSITKEDLEKIKYSKTSWNLVSEYEKLTSLNIKFVSKESDLYPKKLKEIPDAPLGLYVKGNLPENKVPSVGIVGARICSEYGRRLAREYGEELSKHGVQVISGLAKGIDSHAQFGALMANGNTFGVFGCGVDVCYPLENISLYLDIQKKGGIISEYPIGSKPLPYRFPERNRIISGLSDIILVIEAKEKSGSLITVDCALEQGRDVFAVPGRVTDSLSRGCNQLIKQGAGIVCSVEDILNELSIVYKKSRKNSKKSDNILAPKENMVYSCLDLQPKCLDEIIRELPLTLPEIFSILLSLEMKGHIVEVSKNYYMKKNSGIDE